MHIILFLAHLIIFSTQGELLPLASVASSAVHGQQFALNDISLKPIGLDIWYVALPSGLLPSLFKWCLWGPKWPCGGHLGFRNKICLKSLFLQNCLAQVLEIWYLSLSGGPLPSLFKPRSQDPRWPHARGT